MNLTVPEGWLATAGQVVLVIALAVILRALIVRAIRLAVNRSVHAAAARQRGDTSRAERIIAQATGANQARHEARLKTLGSVARSIVSIVIGIIAVLTVLRLLGIPIEPLLATAGVGGVALGFGAQSLVKDYLSGIFMLLEDQYGVGDYVDVGEASGTVEDVQLRVTRLRDVSGQVWYVRNGEIMRVGNLSQGYSTGTIEVPVAYDENAERVIDILNGVMDAIFADEAWNDVLIERPAVAGVDRVAGGTMTIKIFAKTAPNQHWGVQRAILERSVRALADAGVRGPILGPIPPTPPS